MQSHIVDNFNGIHMLRRGELYRQGEKSESWKGKGRDDQNRIQQGRALVLAIRTASPAHRGNTTGSHNPQKR